MPKTIAILNQKGGTGKTTLAVNIARCLQKQGHNVLVVDSDPQASARGWHNISEGELLPVIGLESASTLRQDINNISIGYDYVVIDGAGSVGDITGATIMCSDAILIPVKPSSFDFWSSMDTVELIERAQILRQANPIKVAFVLTLCRQHTKSEKEAAEAFVNSSLALFNSRTYNREIYKTAASIGSTVLDVEPLGKAAQEIESITSELLNLWSV